MNKRVIKVIMIVIVLTIISFLCYKVVTIALEKNAIADRIKTIPEFSFTTVDNTVFTNKSIKSNLPIVFIYYDSECDFCQHEAQSISENIDAFEQIQLVFVSSEPVKKIKVFSKQYDLNESGNITFLQDDNNVFSKLFDAKFIPYTIIYNEEHRLMKSNKGQLNAQGILKILNKK